MGDQSWRNVASVRDKANMVSKVWMIDLEPAHIIEVVETSKWNNFENMWTVFKWELEQDSETFEATGALSSYANLNVLPPRGIKETLFNANRENKRINKIL